MQGFIQCDNGDWLNTRDMKALSVCKWGNGIAIKATMFKDEFIIISGGYTSTEEAQKTLNAMMNKGLVGS